MGWDVVKSNITLHEAEETFANDHIVFLAQVNKDQYGLGDVIYTGNLDGAYDFTEITEPPEGYGFYITKGMNLREMHPVQVCYEEF
jgi:hypothetical protein